ncbi:glycoside hydrolase [Limtongia smithiae]|uniref:glycoside hydrolase n=1 Tax=Limtongia smithiae TaxID=1125753 RepID=UPI0034CF7076
MSFRRPQIVPDLASAARGAEDFVWSRAHPTAAAQPVLPLYKDKPLPTSSRHGGRRRLLLGVLLAGMLMLVYQYSRDSLSSLSPSSRRARMVAQIMRTRRDAVKTVFIDSWDGYEQNGYGADVYRPIAKTSRNLGPQGGLGWLVVDALDTMMLMGLDKQVEHARQWIMTNLTLDQDYTASTFETTIRILGGLLSAHYLSDYDDAYLEKAVDLANRLLGAFDSPSGVPYASVNLHTSVGVASPENSGASTTAEAAGMEIELKYVSKLTGEALYWDKAQQVMAVLAANRPRDGLPYTLIDPISGAFQGSTIGLGARGDSYYEYLLKQFLQTKEEEKVYRDLYDEAVTGIRQHLVEVLPSGLTIVGVLDQGFSGPRSSRMDHLACFFPGLLALGATNGNSLSDMPALSESQSADLALARSLMDTCYAMARSTKTGLAPEVSHFNTDANADIAIETRRPDFESMLRPEIVESLFVMWRITGEEQFRERAWTIFEAIRTYARLPAPRTGYAPLMNVNQIPAVHYDVLVPYFLSETLKYLYLIFDDENTDRTDLSQVVFNTQAHPLPRFSMHPLFETGWSRNEDQAEAKKEVKK